jgi:hypothetical protein
MDIMNPHSTKLAITAPLEGEPLNRVSTSSITTFDLEDYYTSGQRVVFDLKNNLYQEMILREKDFREFIKNHNWADYTNKLVAITCTVDAIIPTWAYMLVTAALQPYAAKVVQGSLANLETMLYHESLSKIDWYTYQGSKVVIKGCSKVEVPLSAYVYATTQLRSLAASIMYGEPCSTVPVFKAKKL